MRVPHLQEIDPRIGLLDAAIGTVLETQGDLHAPVFTEGPLERQVLAKIERCAEAPAIVVDGATRLLTLVERASMAAAGKPLQCECRAGLLNTVGSSLGGFNPSSQHAPNGDSDGRENEEAESIPARKVAFTRAPTCLASRSEMAVLAGDRSGALTKRRRAATSSAP